MTLLGDLDQVIFSIAGSMPQTMMSRAKREAATEIAKYEAANCGFVFLHFNRCSKEMFELVPSDLEQHVPKFHEVRVQLA